MTTTNTVRPSGCCRLDECLSKEGYGIKSLSEDLKIDKRKVAQWAEGKSAPSKAIMEKVACWLGRSVPDIWPAYRAHKPNWKQRFSLLTQRLASVSYKGNPGLYARLCSERALASVKIYASERWAYIKELEKKRRVQPMLQTEFAQITELNKKHTFANT